MDRNEITPQVFNSAMMNYLLIAQMKFKQLLLCFCFSGLGRTTY